MEQLVAVSVLATYEKLNNDAKKIAKKGWKPWQLSAFHWLSKPCYMSSLTFKSKSVRELTLTLTSPTQLNQQGQLR